MRTVTSAEQSSRGHFFRSKRIVERHSYGRRARLQACGGEGARQEAIRGRRSAPSFLIPVVGTLQMHLKDPHLNCADNEGELFASFATHQYRQREVVKQGRGIEHSRSGLFAESYQKSAGWRTARLPSRQSADLTVKRAKAVRNLLSN